MATAEVLRTAHAINGRVRGVSEQVLAVGNRVASVDDKVAEFINGAQIIFQSIRRNVLTETLRWDGGKASYETNS
jgi:hypothetical protein